VSNAGRVSILCDHYLVLVLDTAEFKVRYSVLRHPARTIEAAEVIAGRGNVCEPSFSSASHLYALDGSCDRSHGEQISINTKAAYHAACRQ